VKALLRILVLLAGLLAGCARQQVAQGPTGVVSRHITTEAEAIGVVVADIQRRGGDPRREECSAKQMDGKWYVTAWHIWYPDNKGSNRFVPGGFTSYVVGTDGRILETMPGL
jgi:hypothetical protein